MKNKSKCSHCGKRAEVFRYGNASKFSIMSWSRLEFKKEDLWIGAFWCHKHDGFHLWMCLLPMLPLHFIWPAVAHYRCCLCGETIS